MGKSVLIVEDEPLIADDLLFHLEDLGINEVEIALKYEHALEKIQHNQFDLALLDVNLSGTRDGIDLANFLNRQQPFPFIFITSYYDQETLNRAKKTNPIAYILKPFDKNEVTVNVEMAFHKISLLKEQPAQFFIRDKNGLLPVRPDEILYVEAFDNYAKVFTEINSHIISHSLKSIEDKLIPYGFVRVHKSYLININKISRINEGYVFFEEISIPIGRAYKNNFMAKIALL
ncbi:two component transcriptional regulator, LytTR family [Marivirga sericea]|uniref:Two component transcriptional regulator, LytTR family n=1 Tax=Marivirga sericea TaxID=1028 RepID=A0A1X7LHT5_9BACT|nr:LytTR family transcriptional regulator DNA-binding domain-containing protein [Marivirga sericea]SMG53426.1 two component transcriptional regulator, LytTR family [Marivirga sericea]